MKPDNVLKNAQLALSHRLFVPGWCLNEDFHLALKNPKDKTIYLHKENGIPIAVLYACHYSYSEEQSDVHVAIFVRKSYRGKGIATKLLGKAKRKYPKAEFHAGIGIKGTRDFWRKNKVSA